MVSSPKVILPIATERLLLRPPSQEDGDARFELHCDFQYVRFIGQELTRERCDSQLLSEIAGTSGMATLVACEKGKNEMVGEAVLVPLTVGELELIVAVLPRYRGHRYGIELATAAIAAAFGVDCITSVIACVDDSNTAGRNLVERLGMVRGGVMPREYGAMPRRYHLERASTDV